MKASSESGLCAMVISRTGAETDEDDISKILQHSNFNAGRKRKTLRKNLFCQEANKIADCSLICACIHSIRRLLGMNFHRRLLHGAGRTAQMPVQTPPH